MQKQLKKTLISLSWSLVLPSKIKLLAGVFFALLFAGKLAADENGDNRTPIMKAGGPIIIDAKATEASWAGANWRSIDQLLLGDNLQPEDFSGRYKLLWDSSALYMLLEVTDDVLIDTHPDPLVNYWDDDCAEIFVDEDSSGGHHQFSYNAFAYHVGLDRNVSDMGPTSTSNESSIQTYNDHIQSQWTRSPDTKVIRWEFKISLYSDSFLPNSGATPITLVKDKRIGFMFAYCDADKNIDGISKREHFIGSYPIEGVNGNKDLGYIDASVFEPMVLK